MSCGRSDFIPSCPSTAAAFHTHATRQCLDEQTPPECLSRRAVTTHSIRRQGTQRWEIQALRQPGAVPPTSPEAGVCRACAFCCTSNGKQGARCTSDCHRSCSTPAEPALVVSAAVSLARLAGALRWGSARMPAGHYTAPLATAAAPSICPAGQVWRRRCRALLLKLQSLLSSSCLMACWSIS